MCLATCFHFVIRFSINYYFVYWSGHFENYPEIKLFSSMTVTDYKDQLNLGMNSAAMGVWGWWAFDIFTLIASYMSAEIIAAQTILRSIGLLTFMLPIGI